MVLVVELVLCSEYLTAAVPQVFGAQWFQQSFVDCRYIRFIDVFLCGIVQASISLAVCNNDIFALCDRHLASPHDWLIRINLLLNSKARLFCFSLMRIWLAASIICFSLTLLVWISSRVYFTGSNRPSKYPSNSIKDMAPNCDAISLTISR